MMDVEEYSYFGSSKSLLVVKIYKCQKSLSDLVVLSILV
jgi:hypothetical protein